VTVQVKANIPLKPFNAVLVVEQSKDKKCDKIILSNNSINGFTSNLSGKLSPGTNVLCAILLTTEGFSLARREIWIS
jgi:hypothetical protein